MFMRFQICGLPHADNNPRDESALLHPRDRRDTAGLCKEWREVVKTPDPLVRCVSLWATPVLFSYKAMLTLIPINKCHNFLSSLLPLCG